MPARRRSSWNSRIAVQQVELGIDGDPWNAISAVASSLLQPFQRGGSIAKTGMNRRDFVWADVTALGLLVQLGEHGACLRHLPHRCVEASEHLQDRRIVIERAGFQQRHPGVIGTFPSFVPQAEHRVGNPVVRVELDRLFPLIDDELVPPTEVEHPGGIASQGGRHRIEP